MDVSCFAHLVFLFYCSSRTNKMNPIQVTRTLTSAFSQTITLLPLDLRQTVQLLYELRPFRSLTFR